MAVWAFLGQIGAGLGFLGVGLWQAFVSVKAYKLGSSSTSNKHPRFFSSSAFARYGMHVAVALLAVLHMIFSLISTTTHNNGSGVGAAFALERFGVASVFLLYAVVALISEGTTALPLPAGMVDLLAVFAFGQEFSLFYLTSGDNHNSSGLEEQYYSLLLVPIGVCLLATAIEIAHPAAILPRLVQSLALVLQGTWFFQMAVSLFGTKWMAQGCDLVQQSEGVYTVDCVNMSSLMRGKALATLQFNCHLALLLLTLIPIYSVLSKVYSVPQNYERLGDSQMTEETRELNDGRETGQELAESNYFHVLGEDDEVEEDDELELKEEVADTNGFQRVVI
ncbi:unnamed protein product [Calypogeia fissa]